MRVLITGITGFVGSHLAEFCLARGDLEVYGTVRPRSQMDNIKHLKNDLILLDCDIRDATSVREVVEKSKPDYIFHLAAQSFVPTSWRAPAETLTTNIVGEVNIFEAVRELGLKSRIQIAGSSEEYGMVYEDELPIKETNPLRPLSPYGVSKVAQDLLGYQYNKSYGLRIVRTRGFNHSVSEWTPVIIRDCETGLIDIKYISEIRKAREKAGEELWDLSKNGMEIWANGKFTKVYHLSAHRIKGNKLLRVISRGGIVEVTDNHSIIGENMKEIHAGELQIGERVRIVDLPPSPQITMIDKDLAWLYGFFAAEGDISDNRRLRFSSNDQNLLEKCKRIVLTHYGKDSKIADYKGGTKRLVVFKSKDLCGFWKSQFYARDGNKRVPQVILNGDVEIQRIFLEGYNEGDGLKKGYGNYEFKNFKTKSRILAMGLCFLIANALEQKVTLSFEDRNTGYISINLNSPNINKTGQHLKKPDNQITKIEEVSYNGFVYDFETEEHVFHGGIGGNLLHNTGPRRGDVFVTSNFSKQIAEIEKGKRESVIHVGNLEAIRDFTDVRDMVHAYWLSLEKCEPGEVYNVSSDKGVKIKDMLNMLLKMTDNQIKVEQDPARMRPSDVEVLVGDSTKFRKTTGWKPEIPFERTLEDLLNYWRERV